MTAPSLINVAQLPEVVRTGQCMGCGFCQLAAGRSANPAKISSRYSAEDEFWVPDTYGISTEADPDDLRICPGASMNMRELAQDVHGHQPADPMVGEARLIVAGYAANSELRQRAASGGVTSAVLAHLFATGQIDTAYCTDGRSPESGRGVLIESADELGRTTGSHYHPVDFGNALPELAEGDQRFAFVGLPCEVAALRQLLSQRPAMAARCVLVIGLFCGGINRFSGIGEYLANFGVRPSEVTAINYRDGPWPGRIKLNSSGHEEDKVVPRIMGNSRWNILRYVIAFQGYSMLPRCRICPDQIADFADIAVGDPHLPRFKDARSPGHSAIVARTERGILTLSAATQAGAIVTEPLSRNELVRSQGYTLENRRHAAVYARMARKLGFVPPKITVYDGLERPKSWHQNIYAFVDLIKIKWRTIGWLRPLRLPMQVFEYLFLTFSVRVLLQRVEKLLSGR